MRSAAYTSGRPTHGDPAPAVCLSDPLEAAPNDQICTTTGPAKHDSSAVQNGGDGRVHVLGRWSHSVSIRGRGSLHARPVARSDRRLRDVYHGDELGCPKRAERNRRFEPGMVVCHPGGGSPVWDGSRWDGASFPVRHARLSGSHSCSSWYRSPVRPSSSLRLLPARLAGSAGRCAFAWLPASWARLPWPLARCRVRDGSSRPGGHLVRRVAL